MEKEKRFDEGFDNILTYDYDSGYRQGPLFQAGTWMESDGRKVEKLDGLWNFCPDVFHSVIRSRWFEEIRCNRDRLPIPYDFSFEEWDRIQVPGVWNNQKPEYALYEGAGAFFRTFGCDRAAGTRFWLKVGAANYETRIWLNGSYLGRHLGGFTPFCVEVTPYLKEENRLLILVDNTRKGDQIPSTHYDWFNYGGIHRSVELIQVPEVFIRNFYLQLSRDVKNQLDYRVTVVAAAENAAEKPLTTVIAVEGLEIETMARCERMEDGTWQASGTISLDEAKLRFWSLEDPFLYPVTVRCAGDVLEDEIGFRRIETSGRSILLNGEPVFLKGMCVHEESPDHLRAVTEADIRNTLETAKELGCNFLRLTHYPHSERTARLADRLGLLLWEEIPVYWALEFENPDTFQDAENQLKELIIRDQNRASVIVWSVGNENPDTDARYHFMKRLTGVARTMDKNRLIGASCLIDVDQCRIRDRLIRELDIVGINEYYGWYLRDYSVLENILDHYEENKPVVITETGAEAVCGAHGGETEIYTEECQAAVYRRQFKILLGYPFIRGITPWILFDYASMRRMSALQKGYNLKGIISADRKHRKMAYDVVKAVYSRKEPIRQEETDKVGRNP